MFDTNKALSTLNNAINETYTDSSIIKGEVTQYLLDAKVNPTAFCPTSWTLYMDRAYGTPYQDDMAQYLLLVWPRLKSKDIHMYLHKKDVCKVYGNYPATTADFVHLYTSSKNITANFSTILQGKTKMSMTDLERDAYEQIINLRMHDYKIMPYTDRLLSNCIGKWHDDQQASCRATLLASLTGKCNADLANTEWRKFVEIIDKNPAAREKTIIVLKHWMYNFKRAMAGHVAKNPIMPVLTGPQNNGKSSAVSKMLAKIDKAEGMWVTDIKQLTDPNAYLQCANMPVAFLDEMDKFDKTSAATTKAFLTKNNVTARKLFTQFFDTKAKLIQMIGTANEELNSIITDTTGTRRFWEIQTPFDMCKKLDWWDNIDFDLLWQSVDIDVDPMDRDAYLAIFDYQQEYQRCKSYVEEWIDAENVSGTKLISEWFVEWQEWAKIYQIKQATNTFRFFGKTIRAVPGITSGRTSKSTTITIPDKLLSHKVCDDTLSSKLADLRCKIMD
jgi:hypothetical protein